MGESRSPSMQHAGHTYPRTKPFGISGNGGHRLGRCAEQQSVDCLLVPIRDPGNLCWQCEDHMEILDRQQVFSTRRHPVARRRSLAFGTMPVLAGVIGDMLMIALSARRHMPAERLGPAGFN
ncbi:hypothetical protein C8N36_12625 [Pelagimonas varians]|uniref:Uncharacterized protein n=1 Tax=Pelagimonas varians TaxID=696760 RepID=A0A238L716_9RHOB|nr:hypothetical protein C8N36_12625 [Pelagimonas varians]SMX50086.1 hypothetical protein PEV8663_04478 [Pelagimonas varians]